MHKPQPIQTHSWARAILHLDGDSFFTSVEQSLNPELKNKPLITGQERGIASAMSKEAKALGITRGMPVAKIKREFPQCIIVPGNYEAYGIYSNRMISIMKKYSPIVEKYSIDEGFMDITGLRTYFNCSYENLAKKIQKEIETSLDITVSVGVSWSKSLAKICSNFRKPHGITCVKGKHIHILLARTPVEKIWGIGINTAARLNMYNCKTAYDFISKDESFVKQYFSKRELEIHKELRGEYIMKINPLKKEIYKSISKAKSFIPTTNKETILANLIKNVEEASAKCRKYKLTANKITIMIKDQNFNFNSQKYKLIRQTNSSLDIAAIASKMLDQCFFQGTTYRQTMCILEGLSPHADTQLNLFESNAKVEKIEAINTSLDQINNRFGKATIHIASSISIRTKNADKNVLPMLGFVK